MGKSGRDPNDAGWQRTVGNIRGSLVFVDHGRLGNRGLNLVHMLVLHFGCMCVCEVVVPLRKTERAFAASLTQSVDSVAVLVVSLLCFYGLLPLIGA
jgi:hypothetical protein